MVIEFGFLPFVVEEGESDYTWRGHRMPQHDTNTAQGHAAEEEEGKLCH